MLFLIEYDRSRGQIVRLVSFADRDRHAAQRARIELEVDLNRNKVEREVVVLEAISEDDLRRTHRRYFEPLEDLAMQPGDSHLR
jgi:hypothetical protein